MSDIPRVTIVGAGASGLLSALALLDSGEFKGPEVVLLDATLQTGRVCTYVTPSGAAIELGAGRINEILHPLAWDLFERYDMMIEPFDYALRYARATPAELKIVKSIKMDQLPRQPSFFESVAAATTLDLADRFCTLSGYEALRDKRLPRHAGIEIAKNHPESFQCVNNRDHWYAPHDGFETLLRLMLEELLERGVQLRRPMAAVSLSGERGSYSLDCLDEYSRRHTLQSKQVVFAIAPWELGIIDLPAPIGRPPFMNEVVNVPLFKGFLVYDEPWWDDFGFDNVCLIAENALQKVYFSSSRCLVFFYADSRNSRYWGMLRSGGRPRLEAEIVRLLEACSGLPASKLAGYRETVCTAWARGISFLKNGDSSPRLQDLAPGIVQVSDALTAQPGWLEGSLIAAKEALALLA